MNSDHKDYYFLSEILSPETAAEILRYISSLDTVMLQALWLYKDRSGTVRNMVNSRRLGLVDIEHMLVRSLFVFSCWDLYNWWPRKMNNLTEPFPSCMYSANFII